MLETAGRSLAFAQIHLMCHSLMRMDVINDPSYLSFLQSLVNYGADFGKQNVSNILNSNVICQQMIPEKYETVQLELINALNGTEFSISFHKWSSGIDDFVTVVGYFFTPDFQFNNQILGTKHCEHDEDVIKAVREITGGYKTVGDIRLKCVCGEANDDFESFPCMVQQLSKVILDAIDSSHERKEFFKLAEELTNIPMKQFIGGSGFQKLKVLYKLHQQINTNEDLQVDPIVKKFTQLVGSLFSAISSLAATSENGSCCVTANKVYLWFKKLLKLYTSMKAEDESAGIILKAIEAIKIPEIYQIAVFLDPNFKNLKFLESPERNKLLDIVKKNLRRMMTDDDAMQPPTKKWKCQSSPSQMNDSFSEFMDFAMINPVDDQVNSEIQCYTGFKLEDPVDIVHFWRQTECFPYLKKLARNILNLPSCTFHSDCCFLSAGNEFYQNFQNMPAQQIETFTFLHQNL